MESLISNQYLNSNYTSAKKSTQYYLMLLHLPMIVTQYIHANHKNMSKPCYLIHVPFSTEEKGSFSKPLSLCFKDMGLFAFFFEEGSKVYYEEDNRFAVAVVGGLLVRDKLCDGLAILKLCWEKSIDGAMVESRGQFCAIILDKETLKARIYKDHLGQMSLYYTVGKMGVTFSNSPRNLKASGVDCGDFDWLGAIAMTQKVDYFSSSALFKSIEKLSVGRCLEVDLANKSAQVIKIWDMSSYTPVQSNDAKVTVDDIIDQFKEEFNDAIRCSCLPEASHNIFLSGGLDSSAVALEASKFVNLEATSLLNALTYRLKDSHSAQRLAGEMGIPISHFLYSSKVAQPLASDWVDLISACELPLVDVGHYFKFLMYKKGVNDGFFRNSSFLTGFGSDQFLGGITNTSLNAAGLSIEDGKEWEAYQAFTKKTQYELYLRSKYPSALGLHPFLNMDYVKQYWKEDHYSSTWQFQMTKQSKTFNISTITPESNIAGHFGFELRFPFLDPKLISFVFSIPVRFHKYLFYNKMILRKALRDKEHQLPKLYSKKVGVPVKNRANPTHQFYHELLYQKDGLAYQMLDEVKSLSGIFDINILTQEVLRLRNKKDLSFVQWMIGLASVITLHKVSSKWQDKYSTNKLPVPVPILIKNEEFNTKSNEILELLGIDRVETKDVLSWTMAMAPETNVLVSQLEDNCFISFREQLVFKLDDYPEGIINSFMLKVSKEPVNVSSFCSSYEEEDCQKLISFLYKAFTSQVLIKINSK